MELKQELEEELKINKFIQLESLHRLINPDRVASHLRKKCSITADPQKIASSAPKLFAILVLLGQETAISEYLEKGFCDGNFPILDKAQIPDIGDGEHKQGLYQKQWCIPIVLPQDPHLDLPTEFKAPLLSEQYHDHGSFGIISKVRVAKGHLPDYTSPDIVALKQIRKHDKNEWDTMMREVETLRARRHEHIVPLLASWNGRPMESEYPAEYLNLLFPYASMDLHQWMDAEDGPGEWRQETNSKKLKEYIYDTIMSLCDAVAYLHKDIGGSISSHHDLKPANILLFGRTWKIADFGRTHLMRISAGSDTEGASGLGTFAYHPPEYYTSEGKRADTRHGRALDVWALGCIAVELLILAVYGWSSQMQQRFREDRKTNKTRPKQIRDKPFDDISFHNNIVVVKEWMSQLREVDGSSNLKAMLEIAGSMLNIDPQCRPLSWEVYLDFYELLNPNNTKEEKEVETSDRVQKPNRHHGLREDNPLQRAASNRNTLRVKYLLKVGWSDYPIDTSNLDGEDGEEILKMFVIAKRMKGIRWRYTVKMVRARLMEVSAKSVSPQKPPTVPDYGQIAWTAFSERFEHTPVRRQTNFNSKGKEQQGLQQDEHGMTRLHLLCEKDQFWHVKSFLDRRTPEFVRRILTCKDHKGQLPLHYAAEKGSKNLVEFLLASFTLDTTVLVTCQDFQERTPLHIAADNDRDELIKPLVSAHKVRKGFAEYLTLPDKDSQTALDLARRRGATGNKTAWELERVITPVQ